MPNWDIFRWLRAPNRQLKTIILREKFSWPDAGNDICQELNCRIIRRNHHRETVKHTFKED